MTYSVAWEGRYSAGEMEGEGEVKRRGGRKREEEEEEERQTRKKRRKKQ